MANQSARKSAAAPKLKTGRLLPQRQTHLKPPRITQERLKFFPYLPTNKFPKGSQAGKFSALASILKRYTNIFVNPPFWIPKFEIAGFAQRRIMRFKENQRSTFSAWFRVAVAFFPVKQRHPAKFAFISFHKSPFFIIFPRFFTAFAFRPVC
jgi:hypothetical protein